MHCPGKDLYSQNLELLVPFFECPSLALKNIEKVFIFYPVSWFSKNVSAPITQICKTSPEKLSIFSIHPGNSRMKEIEFTNLKIKIKVDLWLLSYDIIVVHQICCTLSG